MTKFCWLVALLVATSACNEVDTKSCQVSCAVDADCPAGLACGELGLCAAGGETCSCAAGEFIACQGDGALFCNSAANGIMTESCGLPGCNAEAGRCNTCVAGTNTCNAAQTGLDLCGSDGTISASEACAAGCKAGDAADLNDDHCGYIKPAWLPDVCNAPAITAEATLTGTLSTQQDASCTGGVVSLNGTNFCVVRAAKITVGDLKVVGSRPVAFVADSNLSLTGILDVSADGPTPGPGATIIGSGSATTNSSYKGGGGAGFTQSGGDGGGNETGTEPGMAGGPITDRPVTGRFLGGASTATARCGGQFPCTNAIDFPGGGGGGGALLIACRGLVSVTGTSTVDAGGGGGTGGGDHYTDAGTVAQGGAPGGGSGGFVVFQGVRVEIMGKLYANGGGGGAGCTTDNCRGPIGSDGLRSTSGAPGGDTLGNVSGGGIGGSISNVPGAGEQTSSNVAAGAGGGGGSVGRFEVFMPNGVAPILTPSQASPMPATSTTTLTVE